MTYPARPARTSQVEPPRSRGGVAASTRKVFSTVDLRTPGMTRTISIEYGGLFISTTRGGVPAGYYRLSTDVPILFAAITHARAGDGIRSWPIDGLSIVADPAHTSVGLARLRADGSRLRTSWFDGAELAALERACIEFLSQPTIATRTHER